MRNNDDDDDDEGDATNNGVGNEGDIHNIADTNEDDDESMNEIHPVDLDNETFRMLKSDHPREYIDYLNIIFNGDANPNYDFDPLSISWGVEGSAISENTRLEGLEIFDLNQTNRGEITNAREQRLRERKAKSFLRAVAANRSIECFVLKGYIVHGMDMCDVLLILTPFFTEIASGRPKVCTRSSMCRWKSAHPSTILLQSPANGVTMSSLEHNQK